MDLTDAFTAELERRGAICAADLISTSIYIGNLIGLYWGEQGSTLANSCIKAMLEEMTFASEEVFH